MSRACQIAAGMVEAFDKARPHRIAADRKDNGDGRGCRLQRERRRSGGRNNHVHLTANQIGRQRRKAVILLVGPDVLDFHIAAFDKFRLAETFQERRDHGCIIARRRTAEQTDHRNRLLRSCSKRPCDYRSTKRCDEIAPPHVRYPISDSPAVQAGTMEVLAEVCSRSVATEMGRRRYVRSAPDSDRSHATLVTKRTLLLDLGRTFTG